jgi:hypothetical protein
MEFISKKCIFVKAKAGAIINTCIDEALKLSVLEKTSVELEHNGNKYFINYDKIFKSIYDSRNG